MKWVSPKFSLPVLLGLSLTSVSIAVLYVLFKKDEEESKSRQKVIKTSRLITVELKVPRQHVPAVIGRSGSTVKNVESKSGTRIHFTEDNIEKPDRTCVIRGTLEGTNLAKELIKSIIDNQPVIETYEILVPQRACNKIIGRNGETKRRIQASSSAKIILEDSFSHDPNAERRIIIKGTAEQIAAAILQIEDKVREVKEIRSRLEASSGSRQPRGKLSPHNTRVNASEQASVTETSSSQDYTMEVYVCAMETPSQFWIHVVGSGTTDLDKLVSEMTAYYNDEENQQLHALRKVTAGQVVAARFSCDEQWYRGEIVFVTDDQRCEVYFVDFGDRELVHFDYLLELRTDFLSLKWQAIECSLANVKPRENEWSTDACERFAELVWVAQWKVLTAKVRRYKERTGFSYRRSHREGSPIPCVELFDKTDDKEINVGQELINEGLAEPEEALLSGASSTLSLSTRTVSSPTSVSPLAKRAFDSETPAKGGYDSNTESLNTSNIELNNVSTPLKVEHIDLLTPKKTGGQIEEIDLVTPKRDESSRLIASESRGWAEDGSGDYMRNGDKHHRGKSVSSSSRSMAYAPGGCESDVTDDSELELG